MDFLTLGGILFAFTAILLGQFLEGGHIGALMNGPALLIVFGGTIGAVMVETPLPIFKRAIRIFPWIFFPPKIDLDTQVEKIVLWSSVARKQGLLGLETITENEEDEFCRKGLMLLVDGGDPKGIRSILEIEIDNQLETELLASKVYESMGGYSPTIGIIGAVLGLIHVMANLSDPTKLGGGIAVAFVATIYGVGLANLIFLPMAKKLHRVIVNKTKEAQMIIEGLIAISEGENPRIIQMKLDGFSK